MAKQQSKPQPAAEKKVETKKELVLTPLIPEPLAKKIFIGFALALFVVMLGLSHQYGISGDENFHRVYGHHIVNFYSTFGKDNTAANTAGPDSLMVFYGGFYDGTATLLSKALPSVNEWTLRHLWNSMFGFFAMLCAALVAVEVAGWQAGLLTLVMMAFSPRFFGESMNNPKDITMAAGYMLTYVFILKFLKQLPRPTLKTTIGLGISIGVAMGIRIGGLLLIPYLGLFWGLAMLGHFTLGKLLDFSKFKENVWPSFKFVLLASAIGYCFSLIFWPYGLVNPFTHPLEALNVAEKFPVRITILFDGKQIQSTEVPWNYIPQWLFITTPLFGLIGLALSFLLIPSMKRNGKLLMLGFLYFTIVFPLCYVVYKKSVLYDTMRHFFFVYPSIIILSGIAFSYLINVLSKNGKYITVVILAFLIFLPARFMFANHPNEYVYFNELEGGIKGAYGNYETDYYMNSVKQCADWMKQHEDLKRKRADGGRLRLYSNAVAPVTAYFKADSANVSVGYVSYRARNEKDADYEILYCRFVDRDLLLQGAFPPEQAVYVVYADGVPLSCVVRKDDKRDYEAQELMGKNDYTGAVALLEPYVQKYPKNENALANLGLCYLNVQKFDDAVRILNADLVLSPNNANAAYWLGLGYFYKGDFSNAATVLSNAVKANPYFAPPYRVLVDCLSKLGDRQGAAYYANIYQQLGGGRQ
jgi:tetratricopeptide (TPR) repeat protein